MGLFEEIGKIADPVAPAIDFLRPEPVEEDPGSLLETFGASFNKTVNNSILGGINQLPGLLGSDQSARQKLLLGGLVVGGAAMGFKDVHRAWRQANLPNNVFHARSGSKQLVDYGDPDRFLADNVRAERLASDRPGMNQRQLQILSSEDEVGIAEGLRRFKVEDEVGQQKNDRLQAVIRMAMDSSDDAQANLSLLNLAYDNKLIPASKNNDRLRDLWKKLTNKTDELTDDEAAELISQVELFGSALDGVSEDLSIGYAGRVAQIDFIDGTFELQIQHPLGWAGDLAAIRDPKIRAARYRALNHRALADEGYKNLKQLFMWGKGNFDNQANFGESALKDMDPRGLGMELGPDWYPQALEDVKRVFGLDETQEDSISRAVAAVSFLSEAEDWATNITKAKKVLDLAGDGINDPVFQRWLLNGPTDMTPKVAKKAEKDFKKIWKVVKGEGFKVAEADMKKILRLYGGAESVMQIFNTMNARKQRNFFLNIRYPDLELPVTIDRHAYDAFMGLDSGIQDRPIDAVVDSQTGVAGISGKSSDQVYDVIADTYRKLATDLSEEFGYTILPHQVQAVIWEAWRLNKKIGNAKDGWKRDDPYMIYNENGVNVAFETLTGAGSLPAHLELKQGKLPVTVLDAKKVNDLTSVTVRGGSVATLTAIGDTAATSLRNRHPGIKGEDGIFRWFQNKPAPIRNYETKHRELLKPNGAYVSTMSSREVAAADGHPAMRGESGVMVTLPDGVTLVRPKGQGGIPVELGRVSVDHSELKTERLGYEDIRSNQFNSPNGPLQTHQWAAISAFLNADQLKNLGIDNFNPLMKHNELKVELERRGFKPIPMKGVYDGTSEDSWLIFGISPKEAQELGEMFNQHSVLVNQGFILNRNLDQEEIADGIFQGTSGVDVGLKQDDFRSEVSLRNSDGKDVKIQWAATGPEIGGSDKRMTSDSPQVNLSDDSATSTPSDSVDIGTTNVRQQGRQVFIPFEDTTRIGPFADELVLRGYSDVAIYASSKHVNSDNWKRAYEEVMDDGENIITARFRDGSTVSPHTSHVFLPSAQVSGLPSHKETTGVKLLKDHKVADVELVDPSAEYHRLEGAKLVPAGKEDAAAVIDKDGNVYLNDLEDLAAALDLRHAANGVSETYFDKNKFNKAKLKADGKTFDFHNFVSPNEDGGMLRTDAGIPVPEPKIDKPVSKFYEHFGVRGDFSWRSGKSDMHSLGQDVQDELFDIMDKFYTEHRSAVERLRLKGIGVGDRHPGDGKWEGGDSYAYTTTDPGGSIVLNKEMWADPEKLTKRIAEDRSNGQLSPNVPSTPGSILAHELGHVLYGAIRAAEATKKSPFEDALRKAFGGGEKWRREALKISNTASESLPELISEAYSEVLFGSPTPTALKVYGIVTEYLDDRLRTINEMRMF